MSLAVRMIRQHKVRRISYRPAILQLVQLLKLSEIRVVQHVGHIDRLPSRLERCCSLPRPVHIRSTLCDVNDNQLGLHRLCHDCRPGGVQGGSCCCLETRLPHPAIVYARLRGGAFKASATSSASRRLPNLGRTVLHIAVAAPSTADSHPRPTQ